MTFNDLLLDAIKYDAERLAYSVYWLIKNEVVKGTDYSKGIDWDLVNHVVVQNMIERNELNIIPIRLFSVPMGNNRHMLIFAQDEQLARGHYLNETDQLPSKIFDISNGMDKNFWFPDKKKYQTLRELKDETLIFPATAMIYEKE